MEVEGVLHLMCKLSILNMMKTNTKNARATLVEALIELLMQYKQLNTASLADKSRLILPDTLRTLPLYILSLLKRPAFANFLNIQFQTKIIDFVYLNSAPMAVFIRLLYPFISKITHITEYSNPIGSSTPEGFVIFPKTLWANKQQFNSEGNKALKAKLNFKDAYLCDDGKTIYLYVGKDINSDFLLEVIVVN